MVAIPYQAILTSVLLLVAALPSELGSQPSAVQKHTGQVYEENDYRKVRFVARQKEVNETFAIDLIAEQPVNKVESRVISCDGGGGALGILKCT
ncbi:NADH dehydrogenase [ubiquinone] iron-sulfur protein 6 [Chelonia mydas]|uniref:NADH dehydrogenase [ubiquinone] iron-sulfur protein 6 n=1 Tax=Chelonia mydas TaxID=8469 RepID=M7BRI0_CHEMY|nr:NADH dehydrogenase [ubiquinone] iron-sulfur protein 6 [Chelonia mydas]